MLCLYLKNALYDLLLCKVCALTVGANRSNCSGCCSILEGVALANRNIIG